MKKTRMLLIALALCIVGVFGIISAASAQPGWHRGGHGYYSNVSPEAEAAMQQHWNTMAPLRQQLFAKQAELDALFASGSGDSEKINSITKEINTLSTKLTEAEVRMRQDMAKQGMPYGGGYRGGYGHRGGGGYGNGMGCCAW